MVKRNTVAFLFHIKLAVLSPGKEEEGYIDDSESLVHAVLKDDGSLKPRSDPLELLRNIKSAYTTDRIQEGGKTKTLGTLLFGLQNYIIARVIEQGDVKTLRQIENMLSTANSFPADTEYRTGKLVKDLALDEFRKLLLESDMPEVLAYAVELNSRLYHEQKAVESKAVAPSGAEARRVTQAIHHPILTADIERDLGKLKARLEKEEKLVARQSDKAEEKKKKSSSEAYQHPRHIITKIEAAPIKKAIDDFKKAPPKSREEDRDDYRP